MFEAYPLRPTQLIDPRVSILLRFRRAGLSDGASMPSSRFKKPIYRIFLAVWAAYFLVLLLALFFFPWQIYQLGKEGPGSGSIRWIEFSPDYSRDQTLFVDVSWGGVFRSTDGGKTWKKIRAERPEKHFVQGLKITSIPRRSLLLISDGLLLKSDDNGDNWRTVGEYTGEYSLRGKSPLARRTMEEIEKKRLEDKKFTIQQQDGLRTLKARSTPPQLKWDESYLVTAFPPGYMASGQIFIGTQEGLYIFRERGHSWEKAKDPLISRSVRIWSEVVRIFRGWPE